MITLRQDLALLRQIVELAAATAQAVELNADAEEQEALDNLLIDKKAEMYERLVELHDTQVDPLEWKERAERQEVDANVY